MDNKCLFDDRWDDGRSVRPRAARGSPAVSRNSFLTLRLNVPRFPSPPPSLPHPLMSEISTHEYISMANQAYVVAYVTGLVLPTPPPSPLSQSLSSTAVCATTLLYDYALTFGEEVRMNHPPFLINPPDHPHLLPQITRMWTSVAPILTLTRSTLILHSLRFSIPKFLFLINRYVVLPMLVCVYDYSHRSSTSLILVQF